MINNELNLLNSETESELEPSPSGIIFGATDISDVRSNMDFDESENRTQWYRTTSGETVTVVLEAQDENEKLKLVRKLNGETEFRRANSCKKDLFGPMGFCEELEMPEESDTEDDFSESTLNTILEGYTEDSFRGNRGKSWMRKGEGGELIPLSRASMKRRPHKRESITCDSFGNFIVAHGIAEAKRQPKTIVNKKDPSQN